MKPFLVHLLAAILLLSGCDSDSEQPFLAESGTAESTTPAATQPPADDSGYAILAPEDNHGEIIILRYGEEVWRHSGWMGSIEGSLRDLTGDALPNLLISYARGRSFRGYLLLELGPEGVRELWNVEAHATEISRIEQDLYLRLEKGDSLARPPGQRLAPLSLESPFPETSPMAPLPEP